MPDELPVPPSRRRRRYGPVRIWTEYLLMRAGLWLIPLFPRFVILGLAWLAGTLGARFPGRLKRVGEANLTLALGETHDPAERKRILTRCYRGYALAALDMFWFHRFTRRRLKKYMVWDPSFDPVFTKEGFLCLTAHFGNWELMGTAVAALGYPLMSVAAPLRNPLCDQYLVNFRQKTGQINIPQKGAARRLLSGLKEGYRMAVLLDQNTKPGEGGVFVPFFGRQVPVSATPAALTLKVKTRVMITLCRPLPGGKYLAYSPGFIALPESDFYPDPARELTLRMTSAIAEAIREHPECWLWMYKRWKYIPPGGCAEDYPYYARPLPDEA